MRATHSRRATPSRAVSDHITQWQSWWRASDWRVSLATCAGPTDAELSELEKNEEFPPPYEFVDVWSNGILSGLLALSADRPFRMQKVFVGEGQSSDPRGYGKCLALRGVVALRPGAYS